MYISNLLSLKENNFFLFDGNRYYYKFAVLIRKKDYKENECPLSFKESRREICVHSWLISSMEDLDKAFPDMLTYTRLFQGRLYVTIDRKDLYKSFINCNESTRNILNNLVLGQTNLAVKTFSRLLNRVTSDAESSSKEGKCWLFDVDTKDYSIVESVQRACGVHLICTIPTKSGYHVIARKKFNALSMSLPDCVEVKGNASALVAMYSE